jgi:hypothetical protein
MRCFTPGGLAEGQRGLTAIGGSLTSRSALPKKEVRVACLSKSGSAGAVFGAGKLSGFSPGFNDRGDRHRSALSGVLTRNGPDMSIARLPHRLDGIFAL